MRKGMVVLLIALMALCMFVSCKNEPQNTSKLGTKGPAGGIIFYDCDADNNEENDGAGPDNLKSDLCGWRYLEAAPEDANDGTKVCFGYYYNSTQAKWDKVGTAEAIGKGNGNTQLLVIQMGSETYPEQDTTKTKTTYAAKVAYDYKCSNEGKEYTDWFLPSRDEISKMYKYREAIGLSSTEYYWSSSESILDTGYAFIYDDGATSMSTESRQCLVRAIRQVKESELQ